MIDTTSHFPLLIPKKNIKSLGYTIVLIPDYLRGEKWEQNNSLLYSPKEEFLLQCKQNIYNRQWHTTTSLRLLNVHATASIVVVIVAVIRIHLGHLPAHTLRICSSTTNTLGTPPHIPPLPHDISNRPSADLHLMLYNYYHYCRSEPI